MTPNQPEPPKAKLKIELTDLIEYLRILGIENDDVASACFDWRRINKELL